MRFKEFLLEMPKINSNKMNPATSFEKPKGKVLIEKDNLVLTLTSEDNYTLSYIQEDKIVSNMTFHSDDNIKGFVYISNVKVHSSFRSQGIAFKMYEFVMNNFSGIVSGMSLTKDEETKQGSFYIWKKLEQKYKIYSLEDEVLSKVDDIEEEKYKKVNVMFVASKKVLTKKDVWGHVTLVESYFEQLLEDKKQYNIGLIDYVGKNGKDKKLTTLDKEISKITIFENNEKKITFGTEAKKISFSKEKDLEDKKEQLKDEEKLYNKEIKNYNEQLKYYYDSVFEYKFLSEVEEYRKTLNSKIKYLASTTLILEILKEDLK